MNNSEMEPEKDLFPPVEYMGKIVLRFKEPLNSAAVSEPGELSAQEVHSNLGETFHCHTDLALI